MAFGGLFVGVVAATTAEMAAGMFMAGTTNVLISNAQRASMDILKGRTYDRSEFDDNYVSDMRYGALSYGLGRVFSSSGGKFFKPNMPKPGVPGWLGTFETNWGASHLLDINPIQKVISGAAQAIAGAMSDSNLLKCAHTACAR